MLVKRILGIIFIVIGISLILSSLYITNRVNEGREQIAQAQGKVSTGKKILSFNPFGKKIAKRITDSIEKRIEEGSLKADTYATISLLFKGGGGVLIVLGVGLILLSIKHKK